MLEILQQVSSGYLSRKSSLILGITLITSHDHTHQVRHGRPPARRTVSHTRWCDTIRNWLPFQITWTVWAPTVTLSVCFLAKFYNFFFFVCVKVFLTITMWTVNLNVNQWIFMIKVPVACFMQIQDGRRSTVIHSYKSKNGNYYKTTDKYES